MAGLNCESFSRMFQWKVKWVQLRVFSLDAPIEGEMAGFNCESFPRMFQWKAKWLGSVVNLFKKAWLGR